MSSLNAVAASKGRGAGAKREISANGDHSQNFRAPFACIRTPNECVPRLCQTGGRLAFVGCVQRSPARLKRRAATPNSALGTQRAATGCSGLTPVYPSAASLPGRVMSRRPQSVLTGAATSLVMDTSGGWWQRSCAERTPWPAAKPPTRPRPAAAARLALRHTWAHALGRAVQRCTCAGAHTPAADASMCMHSPQHASTAIAAWPCMASPKMTPTLLL